MMSGNHALARVASLAILLAASIPAAAQVPVRDAAKPSATGTATISGTIVTDDADTRPLRRVRVAAATTDRQVTRSTVTDDAGRFVLGTLPAGRYMLSAAKQGYVNVSYGATRPNRPGTALVIAEAQRLTGLTLRMARGAVISGQLVDQNGDAFSGASVSAMRYAFVGSGQRQLVPAGSGQTDDRGQFRIWGLAAGEYIVSANTGFAAAARGDVEIARLTDADIKRGLNELSRGASSPGAGPNAAGALPDAAAPRARTVGYASVFYPGTFSASQATAIKVSAGEERTGVDFPLTLVPTAKVEGTIAVPEGFTQQGLAVQMIGNNPAGMLLDIFRRAATTADGGFTFAGVAPGTYTVVVRGQAPRAPMAAAPASRPGPPQQPTHWATVEVTVDGQDISGLSLTLQPGLTLSGRVQFEGTTPPPDPTRFRINFAPVQTPGEVSVGVSGTAPDASGTFSMVGVTPGRYRINANLASTRPDPAWRAKSALIDGRDALDMPFELRSQPGEIVVTFTDQSTDLSGTVQDAAGQPAPDTTSSSSPRIEATGPRRPGGSGRSARPRTASTPFPACRRESICSPRSPTSSPAKCTTRRCSINSPARR